MGKLKWLDENKGHDEIVWQDGDVATIEAARQQFDALRERGFTAFARLPETKEREMVTEFPENASEVVMVPQLSGG